MQEKNLICISCPMGCNMTVKIEEGNITSVKGNTCKRGEVYAKKELTNPTRIVTSTVCVEHGICDMVSVKTEYDIPKDKIFDCLKAIKGIKIKAPVKVGDVIVENVVDTGVNIIATRNVKLKK